MKRIKSSDFFNDLYRDLRDRKLLLPAVALAVALVAVPVVLSTDSPSAPPPAPPPPADATAAQPAVLAENVGIRDYRKRLEALKSKNPFKQQFALPTPQSVALQNPTEAPDTSAASGVSSPATSAAAGSVSPETPSTVPSPPVSQPNHGTVKHTRRLVTRVVDVTLGPLGETKEYDSVRYTELLPSNEVPIVAYFSASPNSKRAAFLLSAGVVSSDGDGTCAPSPESCYYLVMKPGDQRYLHYRPEDATEEVIYRFKLRKIEEKVVKGSRQEL
jgi:hypothetical protein